MSKVLYYMSFPVLTVSPNAYARDAIAKMRENKVSALFVEENGKYVGVISKTDWIHMVLREECDPNTIEVSTIMASPIITVDKNETLAKASALIEEHNVRHLGVTEKGDANQSKGARDPASWMPPNRSC